MSTPRIPDHVRQAAVEDYKTSGDTYAVVAARHGISKSQLNVLVRGRKSQKRGEKTWGAEEIAYSGSDGFDPRAWEVRGDVLYPLFPERRSA